MKIGELASLADTAVETIRYYEREGLLPLAPRSEGNYRIYDTAHAQRLAFIRHCRSLDMALDEIRVLLRFKDNPGEDCGDVNALLDAHIGHVAERVRALRELERQLRTLRSRCQDVRQAEDCGILSGLSAPAGHEGTLRPVQQGHVAGAHALHAEQDAKKRPQQGQGQGLNVRGAAARARVPTGSR